MAFTKRELSPRPESKRAELDVSGPDSLRTTSNQLRVMLNPAGCDLGLYENGKLLGFAKGLMLAQGVLKCYVEDGLVPEQGCKPWASALDDGNAIMGHNSSDISDCEVMMMVGLPASGKTTWAEKWTEEYPEKRFVLLGRNLILDEMKLVQVLYQEITVVALGVLVPFLAVELNLAKTMDLLIHMAQTLLVNSVVGAATAPKPYWSNMAEPFKGGAARTSSFTCDNIGDLFRRIFIAWTIEEAGLPSELQPNRANFNLLLAVCGYLDAILCFLPCLPCGTPRIPLPASLAPSPRSPYSNFPAGMQQHSGGYNPPPQRNY
ncbi:hypothetical protein D5086_007970 [Populus alba]|uniref:Uncharacterized protein n=1 Tax=Populus alba TaxID=43335 RepID=A0ACC4CE52_POPAL